MKFLTLIVMLSTFALSGFYNTDTESEKATYIENERLCKIFKKKAEEYKKTMRDDVFAEATLASYQHRAVLFCQKAKEAKKAL